MPGNGQDAVEIASASPHYQAFWHGTKRLPRELSAMRPAELPAILIRKGGDYPPFWDKDASFIVLIEVLHLRVRRKQKRRRCEHGMPRRSVGINLSCRVRNLSSRYFCCSS